MPIAAEAAGRVTTASMSQTSSLGWAVAHEHQHGLCVSDANGSRGTDASFASIPASGAAWSRKWACQAANAADIAASARSKVSQDPSFDAVAKHRAGVLKWFPTHRCAGLVPAGSEP